MDDQKDITLDCDAQEKAGGMPTLAVGMLSSPAFPTCPRQAWACHRVIMVIFAFFLLASPGFAHNIRVFASTDGKTIQGLVTYQNGEPVKHCTVTGHDAADEVLAQTKTGEDGKFSFDARWLCDYHIEAETEDGHGGEYVLKAALLPANLPSRENLPVAESKPAEHAHQHAAEGSEGENPWTAEQLRVIQAKLDALQEKLDANEKSIRFRDVLGGIGYIFGVFGLYAATANYRKKNRS
jgi:nickel transport protein